MMVRILILSGALLVVALIAIWSYRWIATRPPQSVMPKQTHSRCVQVSTGAGGTACIRPGSGETFKDCDACPEMTVVPAGRFMMGEQRNIRASLHEVTIQNHFGVGKYEVTFDEWDHCIADGGCSYRPYDYGWGRGKRPVVDVSWNMITDQYLPWLRQKTGRHYRLLSESEWEYAARAGTQTNYYWGDEIGSGNVRCFIFCGSHWRARKTGQVGLFKPNGFGLYDVHGNVHEWVADVWHDGYHGAPTDGSARLDGETAQLRVFRGGSWAGSDVELYSWSRNFGLRYARNYSLGFRVARDLRP